MVFYVVYDEFEGKEYSHRYFKSKEQALKELEKEQHHATLCDFECTWRMKTAVTED